jgi:hypothetical protein
LVLDLNREVLVQLVEVLVLHFLELFELLLQLEELALGFLLDLRNGVFGNLGVLLQLAEKFIYLSFGLAFFLLDLHLKIF